ncbi:MAG: hypothetical protein J0M29_14965 [Chitinophagales bacterium]|nr:hypothetical protein [Chitinophagales bacterium]
MKLSKSHKDKIIGGLITVILSALGLYINHSFEKPDSKSKGNSTAFQAYDTSNQTIIQSSQNNTNVGNVSNEYIGTKNVIHEQIPKSNSANRGTKQSEINIEGNNGSNINTAPIQGNLTQIINPNQKNLKREQTSDILSTIPIGYTVEIRYSHPDQEAEGFSEQIMDLLNSSGRKTFKIRKSSIEAVPGKDFGIEQYPNVPNTMILTVYPQK